MPPSSRRHGVLCQRRAFPDQTPHDESRKQGSRTGRSTLRKGTTRRSNSATARARAKTSTACTARPTSVSTAPCWRCSGTGRLPRTARRRPTCAPFGPGPAGSRTLPRKPGSTASPSTSPSPTTAANGCGRSASSSGDWARRPRPTPATPSRARSCWPSWDACPAGRPPRWSCATSTATPTVRSATRSACPSGPWRRG